jgi:hypothetical protein
LALGIFCDDDFNHVKCVLVVSFHVGVNIFILGFQNKILISFNQEFINRLRKYRLFKETFDHEINNGVMEQNYHNKVTEIKDI